MSVFSQSSQSEEASQSSHTIVLKLIHDIRLETASDRTFIIQCLPPSGKEQLEGPTTQPTIDGNELVEADLGVERPPMYSIKYGPISENEPT